MRNYLKEKVSSYKIQHCAVKKRPCLNFLLALYSIGGGEERGQVKRYGTTDHKVRIPTSYVQFQYDINAYGIINLFAEKGPSFHCQFF